MPIKAAVLLAFAALAPLGARAGTVTVTFVHPQAYTDASLDGDRGARSTQPVLADIESYLESLGAKYLKPDQNLAVEVTDIDLAGRFEPWRPIGFGVRIMRDVNPPCMKLAYRLTQGSRTEAEGQETLVNVNYLDVLPARLPQEPLRYEKAMLAAWFKGLMRANPT